MKSGLPQRWRISVVRAISVLALLLVGIWLTAAGLVALFEGSEFSDTGTSARAVGVTITSFGLLLILAGGLLIFRRRRR